MIPTTVGIPLEKSSHAHWLYCTLDASADNGEDGGWFFWLALHGATHP
jgi:hypothetical protein